MEPDNLHERLLSAARRDFAAFYASATPADAAKIDALVVAHGSLVVMMNARRTNLPGLLRTELERATNACEELFTELRNEVDACGTFEALPDGEQAKIRRALFDARPPVTDE